MSINIELDLLDTEIMAIDASKLEAYERAEPRSKIDKENSFIPDWGTKFDSHKNQITWYGWKINAAVETKSELPIALTLTPANHADKTQTIPLVEKVNAFLAKRDLTKPKYWTMDSGYDYTDIYEHILFEQESQAIIPINKRNAKQPPAGFYDFKRSILLIPVSWSKAEIFNLLKLFIYSKLHSCYHFCSLLNQW